MKVLFKKTQVGSRQRQVAFIHFLEPAMFTGHTSNIRGTFYLDGDKKIASASDDKTVRYNT